MYRVLLVDDEPWALRGLTNITDWRAAGYEIISATRHPTQALSLIEQLRPDVVFTDVRMPEKSGLDLMREAAQAGTDATFVVVSGFGEFHYAQAALNGGAFYYLFKPLEEREVAALLERLRAHLDEKRRAQRLERGSRFQRLLSSALNVPVRALFEREGQAAQGPHLAVLFQLGAEELALDEPREAARLDFQLSFDRLLCLFASADEALAQRLESLLKEQAGEWAAGFSAEAGPDANVIALYAQADAALATARREGRRIGRHAASGQSFAEILLYIDAHYAEQISIEALAARFHFSVSHICHMFKKNTGDTFLAYITEKRVCKARALLKNSALSIAEIAAACGFQDYYYFHRLFKKRCGTPPAAYRKDATGL